MPSPAAGRTGGCWLPAAPLESRCIPEHPGASRRSPGEGGQRPGCARKERAAPASGSARHGGDAAVIHRLKNALRLGTYDTGEARGKRGSASGERQSVSCELLCLRSKSLPEPSQRARQTQLQAGQGFAPGVSSVARSPSTPEYGDAHLVIRLCFPQGCSAPHTLSGDTAGTSVGVSRVGSIPGHCPATSAFPGIYPWESRGSHLWKGQMPETRLNPTHCN